MFGVPGSEEGELELSPHAYSPIVAITINPRHAMLLLETLPIIVTPKGDVPYAVDLRVVEAAFSRVERSYAAFC